jgi:hypothetical protein
VAGLGPERGRKEEVAGSGQRRGGRFGWAGAGPLRGRKRERLEKAQVGPPDRERVRGLGFENILFFFFLI